MSLRSLLVIVKLSFYVMHYIVIYHKIVTSKGDFILSERKGFMNELVFVRENYNVIETVDKQKFSLFNIGELLFFSCL